MNDIFFLLDDDYHVFFTFWPNFHSEFTAHENSWVNHLETELH